MKEMFRGIFENSLSKDVYDILSLVLIGENSEFSQASEFVKNIYDSVMVPIALSLLIIYFSIVFIEKTTNEQFNFEQMFLLFAKVVIAVFLIDQAWTILMWFHEFGLVFLKEFDSHASELNDHTFSIDGDSENAKMLREVFKNLTGTAWDEDWSWFDNIKGFFSGGIAILFASLFTFIAKVVVYVIVFLRILEIYVRTMFAPIALPDIFYNGLNSSGFRFLKSYLAVSIQVVVIYGTTLLYGQVAAGLAGLANNGADSVQFLVMYLGLTASAIGLMLKSQSLVKEFLGA